MSDWHPVHDEIVILVSPVAGEVLIDLGVGPGGTLAAAAHREPGVALVGMDLSVPALAAAAERLAGRHAMLAVADLARPLPIANAAVHIAVCPQRAGTRCQPSANSCRDGTNPASGGTGPD